MANPRSPFNFTPPPEEVPADSRNPLVFPTKPREDVRKCPKCGCRDYVGRLVQGKVFFTCGDKACLNRWEGGLPVVPQDPRKPLPPTNPADRPAVDFDWKDDKHKEIEEVRRRINTTPDFRKGALIPPEGEE